MAEKTLKGKKIAILVETEFIWEEIEYYRKYFTSLGAEVHFMAYLRGKKSMCFVNDVDSPDRTVASLHTIEVDICVTNVDPNDYDAVLMAANYCAVRLREIPPMHSHGSCPAVRTAPAVNFYANAMLNKNIVKGALCHALWILTPVPELLKGRKVICHTVVLADICNAGGVFVSVPAEVYVDDDLVTGRSAANLEAYCYLIVKTLLEKSQSPCLYQPNRALSPAEETASIN